MPPFEYDRARAMKQPEFTKCLGCGRGVMASGSIAFYRITIERLGVNMPAVKRQAGLEDFLGGQARIAFVMGEQEDIGLPIGDAQRGLICDDCAIKHVSCIAQLSETMADRTQGEDDGQGSI